MRRVLASAALAVIALSGAPKADIVDFFFGDTKAQAIDIIDTAIKEASEHSNDWQTVVQGSVDKLIDEGLRDTADRLDRTLQTAIADTAIELRCTADFLRDRVVEEMKGIVNALAQRVVYPLKVRVCNPNPSHIDPIRVMSGTTQTVEFTGYNLHLDQLISENRVKAWLIDKDGRRQDVTRHLTAPTPYLATFRVQSNRMTLTPETDRIQFDFDGQKSSILITHPQPREHRVRIRPVGRTCPRHVGSGDREFGGNGPDVTARVWITVENSRSINMNYFYHLKETRSDWSEARLRATFGVFNAAPNERILRTEPSFARVDEVRYRDQNHQPQTDRGRYFARSITTNGDTSGNDIGNCKTSGHQDAYISISFNELRVYTVYTRYGG